MEPMDTSLCCASHLWGGLHFVLRGASSISPVGHPIWGVRIPHKIFTVFCRMPLAGALKLSKRLPKPKPEALNPKPYTLNPKPYKPYKPYKSYKPYKP